MGSDLPQPRDCFPSLASGLSSWGDRRDRQALIGLGVCFPTHIGLLSGEGGARMDPEHNHSIGASEYGDYQPDHAPSRVSLCWRLNGRIRCEADDSRMLACTGSACRASSRNRQRNSPTTTTAYISHFLGFRSCTASRNTTHLDVLFG